METSSEIEVISSFVDDLFGDEEGVIYAPTRKTMWVQEFFQWPSNRESLLLHLSDFSDREVYLSPVLFTKPLVHPNTFKGTRYLWTEFDGNLPDNVNIDPTIRIQSSTPGKEHWYWRLNEFATDASQVIDATKRLAYGLEADLSVWDYAVVLRPPGTINHKRKLPVKLLSNTGVSYPLRVFKEALEPPPEHTTISIDSTTLPELQRLVAQYSWSNDAYEIFTKNLTRGIRSSSLARLSFECAEMGMSNSEIFVVLEDVDRRCGKFVGRTDRNRRLEGIISYTRGRRAARLETTDQSAVYRFTDFMRTNVELKWVLPGLIPVAGASMIFGPPGYGKSTWAIRMGIAIATGSPDFLGWTIEKQQKVLFLSLEMPHDELKSFLSDMQLDEETLDKLQENFFVWPVGHPYPLDTPDQQIEVLKYIDQFGIELLIIDSLGVAMYGAVTSDDDVKRLNSFLNEDVRGARGCGYFLIHHPRKPGTSENKNPSDMYDSFGSTYIINNAQTVFNLNPGGKPGDLKLNIWKSRLTQDQTSFRLQRTTNRDFTRVEDTKKEPRQAPPSDSGRSNLLSFGQGKKDAT